MLLGESPLPNITHLTSKTFSPVHSLTWIFQFAPIDLPAFCIITAPPTPALHLVGTWAPGPLGCRDFLADIASVLQIWSTQDG